MLVLKVMRYYLEKISTATMLKYTMCLCKASEWETFRKRENPHQWNVFTVSAKGNRLIVDPLGLGGELDLDFLQET